MTERTPIVPIVSNGWLGKSARFPALKGTHPVYIEIWEQSDNQLKGTFSLPGFSSITSARAREFALAILDACDWVDAQQKQEAASDATL